MNPRVKEVYVTLKRLNLDALLLSSCANISYLTGLRSRDAYLLVSPKNNAYITDSRYLEDVKRRLKGCGVRKISGYFFKTIASVCSDALLQRIGFEERELPFAEYKKIKRELKGRAVLVPTQAIVEGLRELKTPEEIKKIKKATDIAVSALRFAEKIISPGKKEIEIAAELERFLRYAGAYSGAFEIIVASGPNSSYPHHLTSTRKIRNHEPVLIDLGADYLGYKSDLTRVFFLGKINPLVRRVYSIVKAAQAKAIKAIKPGCFVSKVDAEARQYIAKKGYGGFFSHNLGHGIGLEVHEAPHISGKEDIEIEPGMVFTVEPGIYLAGKFGIRIEDIVIVGKKGAQLISDALDK